MADLADFYGYDFEAEYNLFGDEFEEVPGVYVIYTSKICLEIGSTEHLKATLETHEHTREWINLAEKEEILVAFYFEENPEERDEIKNYLRSKMSPQCKL